MPTPLRIARPLAALVLLGVAAAATAEPPKNGPYPFPVPPVGIIERLAKVEREPAAALGDDERAVLEAVWKARTDPKAPPLPQADERAVRAHFIASGVTDPKALAEWVKRFDRLAGEAKKATAGAKDDRDKADRLLRFLHARVMAKGYAAEQTTLTGVFETGKYNCVSSACLYYLVGTRLGLNLVGLVVSNSVLPGHATVDLVVGKERVLIETTSPYGFDPQSKAKTGKIVFHTPPTDRAKATETDGYGLAAGIASNRGGDASKGDAAKPHHAARCCAVALALWPNDEAGRNNLAAAFTNSGVALHKAGKHEDALAECTLGRELLGKAGKLEQNHLAFWSDYLEGEFAARRFAEGTKLLERAAKDFPDEKRFRDPAEWVIRAAQRLASKKEWDAAQALADEGVKALPAVAAKRVRDWQDGNTRVRSQTLLDDGDVDGSFKLIRARLDADSKNAELLAGLRYHTQTALERLAKDKGLKAAAAHFEEVAKAYPKDDGVRQAGLSFAGRAVDKLTKDKKFEEAVAAAKEYAPFAGSKAADVVGQAWAGWVIDLSDRKEWQAALDKCAEGLKAQPGHKDITRAGEVATDKWARPAFDKKDWAEAIRIYDIGLGVLPDSAHLKSNRKVCVENAKR